MKKHKKRALPLRKTVCGSARCVYLRVLIQMRKTRSPAHAEFRVRPKARQRRRPARSSAEHPAQRRSFRTGSSNSCPRQPASPAAQSACRRSPQAHQAPRSARPALRPDFGRVVGVCAPAAGHQALRRVGQTNAAISRAARVSSARSFFMWDSPFGRLSFGGGHLIDV